MKRSPVILVASLLAVAVAGSLGTGGASAATRVAPKVVLIVGPAGTATEPYRRLADQAAAAAARYTPNVVRVYSPDATWPAVRRALQGASIVVYLGHGNGWPSRYRDSDYPVTQNGFGLNPTAGGGDTHQYFGEDAIGREVELARNAVVIFSHLCYASGNSEPGLDEGPLEVGQQRVDNYAAGFIRAGAAAVIADAYLGPSYYVNAIFAGTGTIDRIWRQAPSFNGNLLQFASLRSKGYLAVMDTDAPTEGFHRSIVLRAGLTAANILGSATRVVDNNLLPPADPSIAGLGVGFDRPDLSTAPTAGSTTKLTFRIASTDSANIPSGLMVGVRWDPIETDGAAASPAGDLTVQAATAAPSPSGDPGPLDLVSPEVPGEIVAPISAKRTASGLSVPVKVPATVGLYRLVATIHEADGVAYDAASQALVPALIVRVTGRLTATYDAPAAVSATAGKQVEVRIQVTNLGTTAWGAQAVVRRIGTAEGEPARRATLVARWVDLATGSDGVVGHESSALLPPALAPRESATAVLGLTAPTSPGEYLVLTDILVPGTGSLAVAGVPPALVRVSVGEATSESVP